MKRQYWLFLAVSLLLLVACGVSSIETVQESTDAVEDSFAQVPEAEKVPSTPLYHFEIAERSGSYIRPDTGEESAVYSYSVPFMAIANEEDLSDAERETALHNVEVFNQRMTEFMEELVSFGEEMLADQKLLVETEEISFMACDEVSCGVVQMGQIVSVAAQCYYYGGGAHPNSYMITYTFDLSIGQFIDPAQIGDDPEHFRLAAAELLTQQAESLGEDYVSGYWTDYPDIIARWNETAVLFNEDGMVVTFSAYELGPYAMGPVELILSYDELAEVIGEGGLAHLGIQ